MKAHMFGEPIIVNPNLERAETLHCEDCFCKPLRIVVRGLPSYNVIGTALLDIEFEGEVANLAEGIVIEVVPKAQGSVRWARTNITIVQAPGFRSFLWPVSKLESILGI